MKNKKAVIGLISSLVVLTVLIILLNTIARDKKSSDTLSENEKPEKETVTLIAAGDNLIHSPIYKSCKTAEGYDFDPLYENIRDYVKKYDIAAINQETILVDDERLYSGYPAFGTPMEVGESIYNAGFNVVTHATNHAYDRGEKGILNTINFLRSHYKMTVLGINENSEQTEKIDIVKKNGISIAMVNFTYGINGFRLPEGKDYLVNIFERDAKTAAIIEKAEEKADFTVAFMHFGTEYTHVPTKEQKRDVEFLCENGVDLIIGAHPHVVQPVCEYESENGNKCLVYYSLGNFMSNQDSAAKVLGAMASVTIAKENGKAYIESYDILPSVTHVSGGKYCIYMLEDYTDELATAHSRCGGLTVQKLRDLFDQIMNINVF